LHNIGVTLCRIARLIEDLVENEEHCKVEGKRHYKPSKK
jgi:hypothetical protein